MGDQVVITNISFAREEWGDDKGNYKGEMSYEIRDENDNKKARLNVVLNHQVAMSILACSLNEITSVVKSTGIQAIDALVNTENPLGK